MGLFSSSSETEKLGEVVESLPGEVASWTPEQRAQFTEQSDAACREQAGLGQPRGLTRG